MFIYLKCFVLSLLFAVVPFIVLTVFFRVLADVSSNPAVDVILMGLYIAGSGYIGWYSFYLVINKFFYESKR